MKSVARDDNLPHQIRLVYDGENSNSVRVSCNCLLELVYDQERKQHKLVRKYMPGFPTDTGEALAIYRDPKNHNGVFPTVDETKRVQPPEASTG